MAITITVLAAGWLLSGQFVDNSNLKKESAENQKKKCTPKTRNRKDASA